MCETLEKIVIDDLRKLIYRTCREKSGVAVVWIEREGYSLLGGTTRSPLQMRGSACVVACSTETSDERGGGTRNKRGEGEDKRITGVRGPANL